jgi:hypothetical protein
LFHHEHHLFPLQIHDIILPSFAFHNIFAVNRNKLAMNFSSSFSFRVKTLNYCTNLTFGGILNIHCEHNVAVTVAGELCPVIWFVSHTAALPFLKKKSPCTFTVLVSLLSEYISYILAGTNGGEEESRKKRDH